MGCTSSLPMATPILNAEKHNLKNKFKNKLKNKIILENNINNINDEKTFNLTDPKLIIIINNCGL